MNRLSRYIGVDLGTSYTTLYLHGRGIIAREPSVVAARLDDRKIVAAGQTALDMLGRTPGETIAIRPLKDGMIADTHLTGMMLKSFLQKALHNEPKLRYTRAVVCVPSGFSEVENQVVEETLHIAGLPRHMLIEQTLAAAMGAGLPVEQPLGSMLVSIGGGHTEAAVISLGGLVTQRSIHYGGMQMDEAIISMVRQKYNLLIGEQTAEMLKQRLGGIQKGTKNSSETVHGRDLFSGLPMSRVIQAEEIGEALHAPLQKIVSLVRQTLEDTPPELAGDLLQTGITLTGGGALLRRMDVMIAQETILPVRVADEAQHCAAIGAGLAMVTMNDRTGLVPLSEQEQSA